VRRLKYKTWCHTAEKDALPEYVMSEKVAKKPVAQPQQQPERKKSEEKLNTERGQRSVFRIPKQLTKERQD